MLPCKYQKTEAHSHQQHVEHPCHVVNVQLTAHHLQEKGRLSISRKDKKTENNPFLRWCSVWTHKGSAPWTELVRPQSCESLSHLCGGILASSSLKCFFSFISFLRCNFTNPSRAAMFFSETEAVYSNPPPNCTVMNFNI